MKLSSKLLIATLILLQGAIVSAGDGPWSLRLGVSYRDFDSVEFKAMDFRNYGGQEGTGPYGIQDVSGSDAFPLFGTVNIDYVRYNGGSSKFSHLDKMAPVIGLRLALPNIDMLELSIVGNFQFYHLDSSDTASGSTDDPGDFTLEEFQHFFFGNVLPVTPGFDPNAIVDSDITMSMRNKFRMDLYVLDLGVEGRLSMDQFHITAAIGPSLTIAHAKSSQEQAATWSAQGVDLLAAGSYSRKDSDSDTKFLPGAYGAVGISYDFSQAWSLGVEGRYDYVNEKAGTDQAKLDLSGFSGILSVVYTFGAPNRR